MRIASASASSESTNCRKRTMRSTTACSSFAAGRDKLPDAIMLSRSLQKQYSRPKNKAYNHSRTTHLTRAPTKKVAIITIRMFDGMDAWNSDFPPSLGRSAVSAASGPCRAW